MVYFHKYQVGSMIRPKARNSSACYDCHRQKVRCSGDQPCQRCAARQKNCVYPKQDTIVPVPESYLQHLDRTLLELTDAIRNHTLQTTAVGAVRSGPLQGHGGHASPLSEQQQQRQQIPAEAAESIIGNTTDEAFVLKLRETGNSAQRVELAPPSDSSPRSHAASFQLPNTPLQSHVKMRFDTLLPNISIQLPSYAYAVQLMKRAEEEFGDYHTFLRKAFWNRFHATYRGDDYEASDRNWLCRLSLVLALAEANTTTRRPIEVPSDDAVAVNLSDLSSNGISSPEEDMPQMLSTSLELFEQGLALLKVAFEEPTVDDVEALNLASHCSHILNRRMSAYSYAGQSIRIAHYLGLDRPAPSSMSSLEREHRKRVWWTAFCVDRAISTEIGLHPAFVTVGDGLDYPSSDGLSPEEKDEFYDSDLLTAQIRLCEIKWAVVETVGQMKSRDITRPYEVLGQCLQRLDRCGRELPAKIFARSESIAEGRICSSITLRFHQCYILLLRPVLLYQFTFLLRSESVTTLSEELCTVNNICLHAARSNASIFIELAQSGRLVNYGYWDSAHLFSCLSVLAITGPMLTKCSNAFNCTSEDVERDEVAYRRARNILAHMASAGNLASRRHLGMLEQVERDGAALSALPHGASAATNMANIEADLGFEDWAGLLNVPDESQNFSHL